MEDAKQAQPGWFTNERGNLKVSTCSFAFVCATQWFHDVHGERGPSGPARLSVGCPSCASVTNFSHELSCVFWCSLWPWW